MKQFLLRIHALFFRHWILITEHQFQELDIELPERPKYDLDGLRQEHGAQPLLCCGEACETCVDANLLFGGRGVEVRRWATCDTCGKDVSRTIRFRDGYTMLKVEDGSWRIVILEQPLLRRWLRSLFG
jgi:hypothetical protein